MEEIFTDNDISKSGGFKRDPGRKIVSLPRNILKIFL